jgi:hypothetical protein
MARATTAVYVYCVVRAARRPPLARVPAGLPDAAAPAAHPLAASLWLIAADVPLDVYGPPALERRLRDLDWVAGIAVAHEAVVEHLARGRGATVIPMKLFTMFSSVEKALVDVRRRRAAIDRTMTRIAGCEEWGVRVARAPSAHAAAARGNGGAPATGAAFLTARRDARDAAARARAAAAAGADAAFDRLRRHARLARRIARRAGPGADPPILEAAFLVPIAKRTAFEAEARRQAASLSSAGAAMTVTGPWPAYNFVASSGGRA